MIQFAHPEFLWALPAVAVPIVIHLLNRQRHRVVRWAAMDYLVRAERQVRRRVRWENAALLLLRAGAVLLLVLLFARPHSARGLPGLPGVAGASVVGVLDDSASMAQRIGDSTAFDRAKQFLLAAGEQLAGRASLAVYAASRPAPLLSAAPLRREDLDRLRERLGELVPTATSLEPAPTLTVLARDIASEATCIYIVTDFRAFDWGADAVEPAVRSALEGLQGRSAVQLVDVGAGPEGNVGVTALAGVGRISCARGGADLSLRLSNDGPRPFPPSWLRLRLNGRSLPPLAVPQVPAGESRDLPFEVVMGEPGYYALEADLPAQDGFPPDDRRFLALEAVDEVPVLIVEDGPEGASSGSASYYLRAALRPGADGGTCIRPQVRRALEGPPEDLDRYAAVFVCDVANPQEWLEPLRRYAEDGGRVVIFLGSRVIRESWHSSFLREEGGLLPARLERQVLLGPDQAVHPKGLDFSHPLLNPFSGWDTLFGMPRFTGYYALRLLGEGKVLARFDDAESSPVIVAGGFGRGHVVLFASTCNDGWTDWPRSEGGRVTFLPLMHWLVEWGEPASGPLLNLTGGSRIQFPLDPARFQPEAVLARVPSADEGALSEDRPTLRAVPVEGRQGLWFTSEPLTRAGVWTLVLRGRDGAETSVCFAVNVPDGERLLARARSEAFQVAGIGPGRLQVVRYDEMTARGPLQTPVSYWPRVAAAVLALLAAESLLAWAFGRPSADRRAGRRAGA